MLQRIYGTVCQTKAELDNLIKLREELKRRDHRRLGKDLELFSFHDKVGAGLVLYHPNGALLRMLIEDYIKSEHLSHKFKAIFLHP